MNRIYFADLTHTAQGISAATFPLGVSYVYAYAKAKFPDMGMRLFKFPEHLNKAIEEEPPHVLAMSNYSWNFELSYAFAKEVKCKWPNTTVVFGGPNFPTDRQEKEEFLRRRPAIDFYVELEGESGFAELVASLRNHGWNAEVTMAAGSNPTNTCYLKAGEFVVGQWARILDVNEIPSPYLTGALDPFFDLPLVPMLETTRGCPFTCTFCADGIPQKSRVTRYNADRTRAELEYIAERVGNKGVELVITDLNFAMYEQDMGTAKVISDIRRRTGWPQIISASAGKNKPKRTIAVAAELEGAWTMGASIQSTSSQVLEAIRRSNISSEAYSELVDYGNTLPNSKTHSEIILGLPSDTRERHFESLRFGVEKRVNSMRMFQAMLLSGTEMASRHDREKYQLRTKFRTIPGCVGIYEILGRKVPVSEIEEIIVGSNQMSFNDYLECRKMNLIVETFYNNSAFEELFALIWKLGASVFDCLLWVYNNPWRYKQRVSEIVAEFITQTASDLYDSRKQAENYVLTPAIIERYIGGELGINELLVSKARLFSKFEDICGIVFEAARAVLNERALLRGAVGVYLQELERFIILRKKGVFTRTEEFKTDVFQFNWDEIKEQRYQVNPNALEMGNYRFDFYHTREQIEHIAKQRRIYMDTPIGLGRLIQRSNMKLIYRSFLLTQAAKGETVGAVS